MLPWFDKHMLTEFLKNTKCSFSSLEARTVLLIPLFLPSVVFGQVHVLTRVIHFDEVSTLKLHVA